MALDHNKLKNDQEKQEWVAPQILEMSTALTDGKSYGGIEASPLESPGPSWPFMTYIDPKHSESTSGKLEWITPKIYELRSKQTDSKFFVFSYEGVEGSKVFGPSWPSGLGTGVASARWISDL